MPTIQVRHPKTGMIADLQWKDGAPPPTPEQIAQIFKSKPMSMSLDLNDQPPDRRLPQFEMPEQVITAPGPGPSSPEELGKDPEAFQAAVRQSASLPIYGTADQPNAELDARYHALDPRTSEQVARGEKNPGPESIITDPRINPAMYPVQGMLNLPAALDEAGSKVGRGALQLFGSYPGYAGPISELTGGEVTPRPLTGALNVASGAAEGLGALGMAFTPEGVLINTVTGMASEFPQARPYAETLMAPASRLELARRLGMTDPEASAALNSLGDAAAQLAMMKAMGVGSGGRLPEMSARSTLDRGPAGPSMLQRAKAYAESKGVTFGNQPIPSNSGSLNAGIDPMRRSRRAEPVEPTQSGRIIGAEDLPGARIMRGLTHYSSEPLDLVKRAFQGTGAASAELRNGIPKEKNINAYNEKLGRPEARFRGMVKNELQGEHVVLDLASPTGQQLLRKTGGDLGKLNAAVKRAGYDGYHNSDSSLPQAVRLLKDVPTKTAARKSGKLRVEAFPGAQKAVEQAEKLLPSGGFTINPKTGEKTDFGEDLYAVSQFGDRQRVLKGGATRADIEKFVSDNADLLKQDDHHLGGWRNSETGDVYLDVVNVLPKEQALDLGARENQIAIGRVDSEGNYSELPTGGTGEFPEGYTHPIPAGERLSRFREQIASRETAPMWQQDFGRQPNQIETVKRAVEYLSEKQGFRKLDKGSDIDSIAQRLVDVFGPDTKRVIDEWNAHTEKTGEKRIPWYGGWEEAKPILAKHYPELADPVKADIFGYVMNAYANGASPLDEFLNGISAYERYREAGKIEPASGEFIGSMRQNAIDDQLVKIQRLIDLKGEKGAMEWLNTEHPIREIKEVLGQVRNPETKSPVAIDAENGPGQPMHGAFILGPKLGAYALDKNQIAGNRPRTYDSWMNIAANLARATVKTVMKKDMATGEMVPELRKTNVVTERRAMTRALNSLSQKYGVTPEDVQALLWVHVIRPFFERHGQVMKGAAGTHGDFARYLDEAGWFDKRIRGEGGSLKEGGEIAKQRSAAEGLSRGPESLRSKGSRGDAAEPEVGDTSFDFGLNAADQKVIDSMQPPPGGRLNASMLPGLPDPSLPGGMKGAEEIGKYAGSINVNRQNISDQAKREEHKFFRQMQPELERLLGRKLTAEEVLKAAEDAPPFDELLPFEAQKNIAAGVLKLRQIVAQGAEEGRPTKEYFENFVKLQAISKFAGRLLSHFNIEADPRAIRRSMGTPEAKAQLEAGNIAGLLETGAKGGRNKLMEEILAKIAETDANMADVTLAAENVNWENAREVTRFYRSYVKPTANELLTEMRYINMLSSPLTHVINFASNFGQVAALAPATKAVAGMVDAPLRAMGRTANPHYVSEAGAFVKGAAKAFPTAVSRAADVMLQKQPIERFDVNQIPSMGTARNKLMIPVAKFNQAFGSVTRALEASDQFWATLATGGELNAAIKKTRKAGGDPMAELGDLYAQALEAGKKWVFRDPIDPKGETGQGFALSAIDNITQQIMSLRRYEGKSAPGKAVAGIANYFIPFVGTPMNILKRGIEYSPAGFITMIKNGDKAEQFSRALIGSTVFAGAAGLVANTESTWAVPTSPSEKADFYASGRVPYAIKIGDRWFQYNKLGPLSYPIALAAAWKEYANDPKYKTVGGRVSNAIAGWAKFFADQSYVQGLADLTKNLEGDPKAFFEDTPSNFARQLVPLTALQNWVNTILDPTQRIPSTPWERVKAGIPGLSQSVPARITPLGDEAQKMKPSENLFNLTPIRVGKEPDDPVVRAVNRMGIEIGVPSKRVFGTTLDEAQYQQYVKAVGQLVKEQIRDMVLDPDFAKMPASERQESIDRVVREARKEVKMSMFEDLYNAQMEGEDEK